MYSNVIINSNIARLQVPRRKNKTTINNALRKAKSKKQIANSK
jgi:hypothetical protein